MPADWTDPQTWGATAIYDDILNTEIRDNVMALKDPPSEEFADSYSGSAFASTTSTSWIAIGGSYNLTLETKGGDILLVFSASVSNAYLDFAIDGARVGGNDGLLAIPTVATYGTSMQMIHVAQDLIAGEHQFDVYWKVASGTGSLVALAVPQFIVREFS